jgi:predicted CopG family antitoxin
VEKYYSELIHKLNKKKKDLIGMIEHKFKEKETTFNQQIKKILD